jgi:hypothetical protein
MDKFELLHRVRNYVTHAKKVHESSREHFKNVLEYAKMMQSLQFIKTSLADLNEYHSKYQISRRVYSLRRHLKEILPNGNNPSYTSSLIEYELLITECLNEINANGIQSGSSPVSEQTTNER